VCLFWFWFLLGRSGNESIDPGGSMNWCAKLITCRGVFMTISRTVKNNVKELASRLAIL
jgi:hypothetical protein